MRESDVHYDCREREERALTERDALREEVDELCDLATAVENYLSGGMSTAGLRELYAAREALRRPR